MSFRSSARYSRHFPLNWSPAKEGLYWREWSAVVRHFKDRQETPPDRHEFTEEAIGAEKSHKDFTNADFDKFLAACRAITRPADLNSQLKALNGRKVRLCFGIRRLAIGKMKKDAAYILAIARKQTDRKIEALENLDEHELENIRIALAKQFRRDNKKAEPKPEPAPAEQPF